MTSASSRFDLGQSCPSRSFPVGTSRRRRKEGAGHWLVAHREAEERTSRTALRRIKEDFRQREDKQADTPRGVTLDGPLLLRLHCVDEPPQLCSVDVSEQKLSSVKPEDFGVFESVAHIDASINALSLESFSSFVSLRELNLSLNGIRNMTFDASDFPHLQVLDLSYNSLSGEAVISLSRLPRLKVLHLTGNQLHHLPPIMGSLSHDHTQLPTAEDDKGFEALEVLMLDDNKLSSGVFHSLKNLKRLKFLNLQGNRISEIPHMSVMDSLKPEEKALSESNPHSDEAIKSVHTDGLEEDGEGPGMLLPELQLLNLANNQIATEEAVIAAAVFPRLREIDIHSNPLTTQRRGDPPFLTFYLQEKLGIKIKRKKTQEAQKLPLKVSTDPQWQVRWKEKIPTVSKRALSTNAACPTRPETDKCGATVTIRPGCEGNKSSIVQENTEHFFITQAEDEPERECEASSEEGETERSSWSEVMTDAKANPDVLKSVEIQTAVRMLEHTLRNLNVYRDSKPKLDRIQTSYREKAKRIKEMPPLRPTKQPAERVYEMIKEIKESTTTKVVALGSAAHSVNTEECKEALSLLRDMRRKYKLVHEKTMQQMQQSSQNAVIYKYH
ncbi:X-ray radiation resistance-associated protein 1 isoform 2-T2 [Odontesthes bonariensis]|uniref:X-ray radiation resistance-associated protein 1 isoform X2 n=1 Tax=Odontesthes bonariensis TaxID=219752 RepID=UPI003F5808AB